MKFYYYNKNTDNKGKHEVHTNDCSYQPNAQNKVLIGYCSNCKEAIKRAKLENPSKSFDGCYYCSNECHTG